MAAGARLNVAAWREAVRWRFEREDPAPVAGTVGRKETAIIDLPDNGRTRRPDGTGDCHHPDWCYEHDMADSREEVAQLEAELALARARLQRIEEEGLDAYR